MLTTPLQSKSTALGNVPIGALLLSLALGLACTGCLSKRAFSQQTFAFQNPPPARTVSANGAVVAIHSVTVSPLFRDRPFIYRTGPVAYETDLYAGFLAAPGVAIAIAVRSHLLSSGRFRDVIEGESRVEADKSIEVYVSELYGDFSQSRQPAAVLSMRVSLFDAGDAKGEKSALPKNYSRRTALRKNTAAEVMAGWDAALAEMMTQVAADLAELPQPN